MPLSRRPTGGLWLAALTLTAFALQTDDFVIAGVLPSIARGLSVGEAAAGQLVTVFSIICAVVAPIAAVAAAPRSPRTVLTCGMLVFCAANLAVPFASSYPALLALRVLAALAAALTLPAVFSVTATLSPPDRRGRHLATVTAGLTGAVVVGVPLGTWIGAAAGWRATFVAGGALGAAALVFLRVALPDVPPPPAAGLRERLRPLAASAVLRALLAATVAVLGNMVIQTYLAPLLHGLAGVTPSGLGVLLTLTGLAGIAGARLSGTLVDRIGPGRSFSVAAVAFAFAMAGLAVCWSMRPAHVAAIVPLLLLWSAAAWAVPPPVQARVLMLTGPESGPQALALSSSAVYLGASLGAGLGGWAIGSLSLGALPIIAGACAIVGAALFALPARKTLRVEDRNTEDRHANA
ncbi:MFS transporter [Actinomadura verrucosospora]|uniref:Arabinose transporter, MFS-type n=1 Tax=Actinomadura verrucosospora TaxID=46165 RepID=A0A7D3ZRG8_ACTVE|nr:MFS transporter [Actinomadura verrucosospora]QKG27461.1 Arabinose transporter, MFS-type [Actinomadura verrucosospora]